MMPYAYPSEYYYPAYPAVGVYPRMIVGRTGVSVLQDEIALIDQDVQKLDAHIPYVASSEFKTNWDSWRANWRAFADKYGGSVLDLDLSRFFISDDVAKQVEGYREQLASLFADYGKQRQPDGSPVPPVSQSLTAKFVPGQSEAGKPGFTLPWWGWTLIGVAAVGTLAFALSRLGTVAPPETP